MKKVLFLSLLIIIGILFTSQIKRACLSLVILIDVVRSPEKTVLGRFVGGPAVTKVTVPGKDRVIHADLYRSRKEGSLFPLLLVHDLKHTGKDDEPLVILAKDLARAGFLVLVPDFGGMNTLRIRSSDAEDILQSYLFLSREEHAASRGGMLGIGYGARPMPIAAADARIRDKVSVVATFGEKDRVPLPFLPRFMHIEPIDSSACALYQRRVMSGWRMYRAIYNLLEIGGTD
jgi:hypothetical protein